MSVASTKSLADLGGGWLVDRGQDRAAVRRGRVSLKPLKNKRVARRKERGGRESSWCRHQKPVRVGMHYARERGSETLRCVGQVWWM